MCIHNVYLVATVAYDDGTKVGEIRILLYEYVVTENLYDFRPRYITAHKFHICIYLPNSPSELTLLDIRLDEIKVP